MKMEEKNHLNKNHEKPLKNYMAIIINIHMLLRVIKKNKKGKRAHLKYTPIQKYHYDARYIKTT